MSEISTEDEDVFRNLMEMDFDPAEMVDEEDRANYIKYLEKHKEAFDAE